MLKWRAVAEEPRVRPDILEGKDFPVLFGRYTLLGLLGEGGMARVFRAELQGLRGFRKPAALKVIRAVVGDQDERLTRALIREAQLGGLLQHPNVVETYDFGEEAGQAWIAMEQIRGVSLERLLETRAPLPSAVALEIAAQICGGLHHAHTLQDAGKPAPLVHRDLKPSNVMVADSGLVKVLDFGIAKATHLAGNTTETGLTKGTPAYMSPEQAQAATVDPRSDVFAAGALLYEMLTGRRFFSGDTVYQIMLNVAMVEERLQDSSLMVAVEAAAPGAGDVVRRCLRAAREDRYASAGDLEQAIRSLQGPIQAPGPIKAWVDRCRAEGDPRFLPPVQEATSAAVQLKGSSLFEELSLDAPEALDTGAGAAPPAEDTLQPTRLVPPARRGSKLLPLGLGLGLVGLGLSALVVVLLLVVLPRVRTVSEETGSAGVAARSSDRPEGAPAVGSASTAEPSLAMVSPAPTAPGRTAPRDPAPPALEPNHVEPVRPDTHTARPTPRESPELKEPAEEPVQLRHVAPSSVVIGSPVHIKVAVEPAGRCRPRLRYAPWNSSDGGWRIRGMSEDGGEWETDLLLPYEVAWRSGFRYQVRCEDAGRIIAAWPKAGSQKVPALAR